jgi:hypothetical protein
MAIPEVKRLHISIGLVRARRTNPMIVKYWKKPVYQYTQLKSEHSHTTILSHQLYSICSILLAYLRLHDLADRELAQRGEAFDHDRSSSDV